MAGSSFPSVHKKTGSCFVWTRIYESLTREEEEMTLLLLSIHCTRCLEIMYDVDSIKSRALCLNPRLRFNEPVWRAAIPLILREKSARDESVLIAIHNPDK